VAVVSVTRIVGGGADSVLYQWTLVPAVAIALPDTSGRSRLTPPVAGSHALPEGTSLLLRHRGWNELTRRAASPPALSNLAAVLYQRDKLEEAFETISSALQRDPADSINQDLFERIAVAREQSRSEARVPWYRKLWRQ
jgi:hypothetical protein